MTNEQRAAALRLADALDRSVLAVCGDAAALLRSLAAEPVAESHSDRLQRTQRVLKWNRAQNPPPLPVGYELSIAMEIEKLMGADAPVGLPAGETTGPVASAPAPVAEPVAEPVGLFWYSDYHGWYMTTYKTLADWQRDNDAADEDDRTEAPTPLYAHPVMGEALLPQDGTTPPITPPPPNPPVAWLTRDAQDGLWHPTAFKKTPADRPLYTAPPRREPLSDEEVLALANKQIARIALCRLVERAHGIGGSDE